MSNNNNRNCTATNGQPRQLLPRARWAFAPAVPPQSSLSQVAPFQVQEQMMVEQEKRALDAWTTKLARTKRKMARQFRAHLKSSSSSSSSTTTSSLTPHHHYSSSNSTSSSPSSASARNGFQNKEEEEQAVLSNNVTSIDDLYTFFSPDNKVCFFSFVLFCVYHSSLSALLLTYNYMLLIMVAINGFVWFVVL